MVSRDYVVSNALQEISICCEGKRNTLEINRYYQDFEVRISTCCTCIRRNEGFDKEYVRNRRRCEI